MRFTLTAVLALAVGAYALPQQQEAAPASKAPSSISDDVTVGQAGEVCGKDLEMSCCDNVDMSGDAVNESSGVLAGVASGLLENGNAGLFSGCSKLSLGVLINVHDILNHQCKQTAACCQKSGKQQDGLVNAGLPCVALGGLV